MTTAFTNLSFRKYVRTYVTLLTALACSDSPTGPRPAIFTPSATTLARITCVVDVRALVVSCPATDPLASSVGFSLAPSSSGSSATLLLGGQSVLVALATSSPAYSGGVFSFAITVTNLIPQPLGTKDGLVPDPDGVRAFFSANPAVTGGSGSIDFTDPATGGSLVDGFGTFTATHQAFYQYSGMLDVGATSAAKRWRLRVPSTVTTFTFSVDINAAVPHLIGWVDVTPATSFLRAGQTAAFSGGVRNVVGEPIVGAPIVWSTDAPSIASVNASSGLATAGGDGTATITATSTVAGVVRTGTATVTVATASGATTTIAASPTSLVAGGTSTVTVQAKTASGANISRAGDVVVLTADGGTLSAVAAHDGSFTATLTSTAIRDVHVTGAINGNVIAQTATISFIAGRPAAIAATAGDAQSGVAGTTLAIAPAVRVTDSNGNPVSGLSVSFTVVSGGGSVVGATQTTNSNGVATVGSWTLGTTPGPNVLAVSASGLMATFIATGVTGAPATITKVAGDGQTAITGTAVTVFPSVVVTDANGNPVTDVSVTFAVASGAGSVTSATQITSATGIATAGSWTLGAVAGPNTLTATAGSLSTTFTATGTAGVTLVITKVSGDGQSAMVGTSVAIAPSIRVTGAGGTPVAGASVTFAVGAGGGSITGAVQVTNANGVATIGSWTLGAALGSNTMTAVVGKSLVIFTATGVAGAGSIAKSAGDAQTSVVGNAVAVAPRVLVADGSGNPRPAVIVTFAVASGGGSVVGATQTTDANGFATVGSWTLGTTAGSNTLTATAGTLTTTFTATGTTGAVHHFAVETTAGSPIGAQTAGLLFAIKISAQDVSGNTVTSFVGTVTLSTTNSLFSSGTATTTGAFVSGVLASHDITFVRAAANVLITATNSAGAETGTSATFVVNAGVASKLQLLLPGETAAPGTATGKTGAPSATTAGAAFTVLINAVDANWNVVTTATPTVHFTSTDPAPATLPADAALVAGTHTSTNGVILKTPSSGAVITATDLASTLAASPSAAVVVSAGAVDHFIVEAPGGGAITSKVTNVPFTIRITAFDAFNNIATAFAGTTSITSTGTLTAGGGTSASFVAGVLSPSVTISNGGSFTITATRTGGAEAGTSAAFTVTVPPTVSNTTPAINATNIALTSTIAINFSAAVNATTSAFIIKCPSSGTALAYVSSPPLPNGTAASTFTLTPSASLPGGSVCQVTVVAAQITDAAGTHMAADNVFTFTTTVSANDDTYPQTVIGNVSINSASIPYSVTGNDNLDPSVGIAFSGWLAAAGATEQGGSVAVTTTGANRGQFTYDPPAGFAGTDHFTYTIAGTPTISATVTLTVSGMVWFVDNQAGACSTQCGRMSQPFTTLAAFQAVNDGTGLHPAANQTIFLAQSATAYTGPVTLSTGQKLVGQDATVSLSTIAGLTPPTGSTAFPAMNSGDATTTTIAGTSGGVTLASSASGSIHGLTIAPSAGTAISATTFGTLSFSNASSETPDVTINATGTANAMALTSGTVAGILASVSSAGGTNALQMTTVSGSLTINAGALSGASGSTVAILGGNATIVYAGTVSQTNAASLTQISSHTGGSVDLQGNLSCTVSCTGILVNSNAGGTYTFSGATKTLSTGGNIAISAASNTVGAIVQFTNGGLIVSTTTATAINVTGSGTNLMILGTGNTVTTTNGGAAVFGSQFSSLTIDGTVLNATGGPAVSLSRGAAFIGQTNAVNATSTNSNLTGVTLISLTGAVTMGPVAGAGISGSTGIAFNVSRLVANGTALVSYSGPITKTSTGSLVTVSNHLTNDVTFSGALSCTASCAGISVLNNNSGVISFTNASKTLNTSSTGNRAVTVLGNTGATINFANGGLAITTTGGDGFTAQSGGTVTVSGTGNTVTTTTGIGLNVQSVTSGGLVFERVTTSGGGIVGIVMTNTGAGGLTVTGAGGRCDAGMPTCTGGTIGGATGSDGSTLGSGVYLDAAPNVSLTKMRLSGTHQNFGIYGVRTTGLTLDGLLLDGTFGTNISEGAIAFDELSGTALIRGSTITPASGGFGHNVRVTNATAITLNRLTLDADTIGYTATNGVNGVYVLARAGTANVTIQNSKLLGGTQSTVMVTDSVAGTTDLVFTGNTVQQGTGPYGAAVGSAVAVRTSGASVLTYQISNNTFTNLTGPNGLEMFAGLQNAGLTGSADGSVTSNTFGVAGDATSGALGNSILFDTRGSGTQRVKVADNGMYGYGSNSLMALVAGDGAGLISPKLDITIVRNTIKNPRAAAAATAGVYLEAGSAAGHAATLCVNFGEGGANDIKDSGSSDYAPFALLSTTISNGGFLKFLNYLGGPDAGSSGTAEGKLDVQVKNANAITTLSEFGTYGLENLLQANQIGASTAVIGRTCNLPLP